MPEYTRAFPLSPSPKYPNHSLQIEKWVAEKGGYGNRARCQIQIIADRDLSYQIEMISNNKEVEPERHWIPKSKCKIIMNMTIIKPIEKWRL